MLLGGKYILHDKIGAGIFSTVWLAEDTFKKQGSGTVAIKIIDMSNSLFQELELRQLFERECESLRRLNHPNIIRYLDSGIDENKLFIVTEYFESVNIEKFIAQNSLNYETTLNISIQILEAIAEAHRNNVIHRDIKPHNILVDDSNEVRIVDFGISKIVGWAYDPEKTLKDFMTPSYAPPEQLMRGVAKPEGDLYSIGALICFMLSGKHPPEDKSKISSYVNNIECSSVVKEIVENLLKASQQERPRNAFDVIRPLKQELHRIRYDARSYYLGLRQRAVRDMYELGLIQLIDIGLAKDYIQKDINDCTIYRRNENYYIIGKSGKYHCKYTDGALMIVRVNSISDHPSWEAENARGIRFEASFTVIGGQPKNNANLADFIQLVNDEEQKRTVKAKRENKTNKLIDRWEEYLEEEVTFVEKKKRLCQYNGFYEDDTGTRIIVRTDEMHLHIEKGDPIQMTSINGKMITVGKVDGIENKLIDVLLRYDIDIENIANRGSLGIDVIQAEMGLRRLREALKSLKFRKTINPNLIDIVTNPETITPPTTVPISSYFQDDLDNEYKTIVQKALGTDDIFLIQGPPGTGKTTVITEIVCQIFQKNPNAKVLLTSQSNVAVDQALNRIKKYIPDLVKIRIGRNDKIADDSESLLMANQMGEWVEQVKAKSISRVLEYIHTMDLQDNEEDKVIQYLKDEVIPDEVKNEALFMNKDIKRAIDIAKITKQWHKRLGKLEEFDEIFANKASVVAATCLGIASRHALNDIAFDWVIVDEAARATAPELLVPLIRGRKIILVGDHRQLPPVVKSEDIEKARGNEQGLRTSDLEKSLFEDLIEMAPREAKVVLTSQYRMHPVISQLINEVFYPTETIIPKKDSEERRHHMPWWPTSIYWMDTSCLPDRFEEDATPSKRNNTEARIILKCLEQMEKQYEDFDEKISVAVISGYDAQKKLLTTLINPSNQKWKNIKILVDNIDAFQGSETDVVIFNLVRSNELKQLGFLSDSRRLNVALSRGKTLLLIVGDAKFASKAYCFRGNPFVQILEFIRKNPDVSSVEEVIC